MLHAEYRPTTWTDYVGQDKAVKTVRRIIERPGFDRGAFWIEAAGTNNSGIGKTTLAGLIAGALADDFFVESYGGGDVDKATVKRMQSAAYLSTWSDPSKPYRVFIIDEAHAMTAGAVDTFLPFLESLPRHCVVIFTTTRAVDAGLFGDHDSGPFASRCHRITLTNQGVAKAFALRAQSIARRENMDGQPIERYERLVKDCKNNMRAVLRRIESGAMLDG